jgi:hypothetical protein
MSSTRYDVVLTLIEDLDTMKLSATEIIELQYYGTSSDNLTEKPNILPYGSRNFSSGSYVESVNWTDEDDEIGPFLLAVDDEHGLSAMNHRINYTMNKLLLSLIEKPHVIEFE